MSASDPLRTSRERGLRTRSIGFRHKVHKMCVPGEAKARTLGHTATMVSRSRMTNGRQAGIYREVLVELDLIIAACRARMGEDGIGVEAREGLRDAVSKLENAAVLLQGRASDDMITDVENPVRALPGCSSAGCDRVAGAVVNGALLCGEHASEARNHRH